MIPYSRQYIEEDDIKAVIEVLKSDFLTQGPKIKEFETALAAYCCSQYAVVFSSGTAALHAAYFAADIGQEDEIITSPITFVATANAAIYLGAKPVFVDVEPDTGNLNFKLLEKIITDKTKAIVPVHYAGHPVDIDPIHEIAKKHNFAVIEDACHALGARYKNKKIGSISDMTVFSFHPVKPITTGEGGAVTTNKKDFFEKLLMFREHGIIKNKNQFRGKLHGDWYYEMQSLGFNYRLTDIQSALGINQLQKLDVFIEIKKKIVKAYEKAFFGNPYFDLPSERPYAHSTWHLYPISIKDNYMDNKPKIFRKLMDKGIGVQVHYIPVYLQPYYREIGFLPGLCSEAEIFYRKELSIPIYQGMNDKDIRKVIQTVLETFKDFETK